MGNQLLFEPRRARVWAAKLAAVVLAGGCLALAVLVAYWTGLYAVASARDLPIPTHAMVAAYKQAVLGTIFVAGAAGFGYVAHHAAAQTPSRTLGLLFATRGSSGIVVRRRAGLRESGRAGSCRGATSPPSWSARYSYYVDSCVRSGGAATRSRHVDRLPMPSVYFLVILAVVTAASLSTFRSRDLP